MNLTELKKAAVAAIDYEHDSIIRLSRYIHSNPETAYHEKKAVTAITDYLLQRDFEVKMKTGGIDTAFTADLSLRSVNPLSKSNDAAVPVALIAEYDALPEIGHGCGHNLIAAAAVAAAAGVAAAVRAVPESVTGSKGSPVLRLIGTPAEEIMTEAAGKNRLIDAGVFKNVGSALMFHPWIMTGVAEKDLGCTAFRIEFRGQAAHAAADPWNGRNALDAAVLFYNSLSLLRQQLPAGVKLHCILPEAGEVLNIIPDRTAAEVMIRSTELKDLKSVEKRIRNCMLAAASASGCTTEISLMAAIKPVKFSPRLFKLAAANMKAYGETLEALPMWEATSDFGDVSHEVPSLALLYKTHDENTCWHSKDAAAESAGDAANEAMIRASKILAGTAIDLIYR